MMGCWRTTWVDIYHNTKTFYSGTPKNVLEHKKKRDKRKKQVSPSPPPWSSYGAQYDNPGLLKYYRPPYIVSDQPTLEQLDFALSLFVHFLLPLTYEVPYDTFNTQDHDVHPETSVDVVHSSHHGVQALIGGVRTLLSGVPSIIWDHGMLWRERTRALSEIEMFPPFVRNCLIGLVRMSMRVSYCLCSSVVSCTRIGNPDWEAHIADDHCGADGRMSLHMKRRQCCVVNGMEFKAFKPSREKESKKPTAIMLSHVYSLKDIKNAIRASYIIVHQYRVNDFQLLIYGALDKDTIYVRECKSMISALDLEGRVLLMGIGKAADVLPIGWIFVNSSLSEGLPLALGEAGLTGLPVVCTDVGGSRDVRMSMVMLFLQWIY